MLVLNVLTQVRRITHWYMLIFSHLIQTLINVKPVEKTINIWLYRYNRKTSYESI